MILHAKDGTDIFKYENLSAFNRRLIADRPTSQYLFMKFSYSETGSVYFLSTPMERKHALNQLYIMQNAQLEKAYYFSGAILHEIGMKKAIFIVENEIRRLKDE